MPGILKKALPQPIKMEQFTQNGTPPPDQPLASLPAGKTSHRVKDPKKSNNKFFLRQEVAICHFAAIN
jgi:hypothetical protein